MSAVHRKFTPRSGFVHVDFEPVSGKVISPAKLVKKVNAIHCLAVASKVLAAANDRLQSTDSPQFTEAGNNFYLMKTDTIAKILNSDKFGDYLLNILQTASAEDLDIAKAVTDFHKSI